MIKKAVVVRAVDFSTGPFCTEFWCEELCDDGIFGIGVGKSTTGSANNRPSRLGNRQSGLENRPKVVRKLPKPTFVMFFARMGAVMGISTSIAPS